MFSRGGKKASCYYGAWEQPKRGEYNYPKVCADCGNDFQHNLKARLGFDSTEKIKRTACNEVRHDDHIHIQI